MSRLLPADGRVAVAVATTGADAAACLAQARAALNQIGRASCRERV